MKDHITVEVPVEWEYLQYKGVGKQKVQEWDWGGYCITKYPMCMYVVRHEGLALNNKRDTLEEAKQAAIDHWVESIGGKLIKPNPQQD